MRTFICICGNRLYFENSRCLSCQRDLGWCPACHNLSTLVTAADGGIRCGITGCEAVLVKCRNYETEDVCNRCVLPPATNSEALLCDACRLTEVIPDLSITGNREKWYRLEVAKRRLLFLLDHLKLPYGRAEDGIAPPLSFDFKADAIPVEGVWRVMTKERVYTGYHEGKITINIREADDAEREKLRVDLNEAQRTLSGHFRHEIGHYYWQMLVSQRQEDAFRELFGDHNQPSYAEALQTYYRNGPPGDWQASFVSAYATMHPWEDFAETFALYLDMIDLLDTANDTILTTAVDLHAADAEKIFNSYLRLGLAANELNRSMGLLDLVPEVLSQPVRQKLAFVHQLIRKPQ
ncbi:MAG: zinc-binding metallopeptidase family protein [Planctomycetaceae bacterium]